jgi:hypothetical protein
VLDEQDAIESAFNRLDLNDDGKINASELKKVSVGLQSHACVLMCARTAHRTPTPTPTHGSVTRTHT